jgi:5-methylthioadenosine/S-adenosylhomocysteine deaminase
MNDMKETVRPDAWGEHKLPARKPFVIRNAYVMTMDPDIGDIAECDVHVNEGVIVSVGAKLAVSGAVTIDGRDMIALPGFVETHWHMWNTLLRCMSGEKPEHGYFRTSAGLGRVFEPEDIYQGTRLACTEAIYSGITSVHDWCHNVRGPASAEAALRALRESGLRARFSYGCRQEHSSQESMDLDDLARLHGEWERYANGGLISLGMAWRGPSGSNPTIAIPPHIYTKEVDSARRLNLPISVHASGPPWAAGQIHTISQAGLLGSDMQVIHANSATEEEIEEMAASGASVTVSPFTELHIGYGLPRTCEFLAAGIPTGLSVDTTVLAGNADMFGIMKVTQSVENGKAKSEFQLTARRTLELATIDGARSMGMDDTIGSLKAGKRADIILISTRDPNLGVFADPAHMLVSAAQPANVDTVIVDGRILKRNGRLTMQDGRAEISRQADSALAGVRERAGWW